MTLTAFRGNVSVVDQATMNSLLKLDNFIAIYDGTGRDSFTGSGVYEFNGASYNHAIYFTANDDELGRVELELVKYGEGADVVIEVRSGLNIDGSTDGTLLKSVTLPKEFLPGTYSYVSIPIGIGGLSPSGKYWIVIKQNGDSTNHFRLVGEASQNASYPCYQRAGTSGGWTQCNSIHFKTYSGQGTNRIKHIKFTSGYITIFHTNTGLLNEVWTYLEDVEGTPTIADKMQLSRYDNETIKEGVLI